MIPLNSSGCTRSQTEAEGCPACSSVLQTCFCPLPVLISFSPAVGEALSSVIVSLSKETFYSFWRQKWAQYSQCLVLDIMLADWCSFAKANGKTSSPWDD